MALKIVLDWDLCESNFICNDACPEVFQIDEEKDELIVAMEEVPDELAACVEKAATMCPKGAITLSEN